MLQIVDILLNVIGPLFLFIGVAVFLGHRFQSDPRGFSVILIYLFIPALVFRGISRSPLEGPELAGILGVVVGVMLVSVLLGLLIERWQGYDARTGGALVLSVLLMNAANYGVPANVFAYGPEAEQRAIIYYVGSMIFGNAAAVYFASRGHGNLRAALRNVASVPITYAAVAGLIFNLANWTLPLPLERAINIAADGAIPGMLALLGLTLARTRWNARWKPVLLSMAVRLVIAPLVAVPLALLLGLSGLSFQVAVTQSAMPTAVLTNALASQFGSDAELTAAATLASTLASVVTLTIIISLLRV